MAPRRKRALTLPLIKPAGILWWRQKSADQYQSILLSNLPLEVRELIYEHTSYFPDQVGSVVAQRGLDVHIFSHAGKLVWRRRSGIDGSGCSSHCYRKFYPHTPRSLNLLALVLTCRRIYSEAIDILYSRNTFVFRNLTAITSFLSNVLPQRLNCIRALRLKWLFRDYEVDIPDGTGASYSAVVKKPFDRRWDALREILLSTRMSGLRKLHITLQGDFLRGHGAWDEQIFEPMRRMQGLREFEVEANWMPTADAIAGGQFRYNVVGETGAAGYWDD
ncbi:hypothetical protein BJY01DRAFT_226792 [Aspergillus pseudoustus]|uniref:DUF7730 domain-containing protein n=1 Tax=Aspergillus pseudoustus TaxID=1810923 RepID=A0ABR4ITF8_9EURO